MNEINPNLEFSLVFQRAILARILKDAHFAIEAKKIISDDIFDSGSLKWLCRKIISDNIFSIQIIVDTFKEDVKFNRLSPELKQAIAEELKILVKCKDFDEAEYGIEKLRKFILHQRTAAGLLDAATKLKSGTNIDLVRKNLKIVLADELIQEVETTNLVTSYKDRFSSREKKVASGQLIFFPTGIKELDKRLRGIQPGQVWSFFGDTNIGKSILAMNVGRSCMFAGYKIWHVVLEDLFEMTCQRYDSSITRTPYETLLMCDYDEQERKVIERLFEILSEKRNDNLYVTKIEEGCTMGIIEDEFNRLQIKYSFRPMVMVIDSPHCMEPVKHKETTRLDYKQIYLEIRKFARREGMAIFLFDQSKQDVKDKVAGTGASSESYDKARIVDAFITINQTRMHRKEGVIEFYVAKMKDGEKNFSVMVRPKFNIMRYDSIEN